MPSSYCGPDQTRRSDDGKQKQGGNEPIGDHDPIQRGELLNPRHRRCIRTRGKEVAGAEGSRRSPFRCPLQIQAVASSVLLVQHLEIVQTTREPYGGRDGVHPDGRAALGHQSAVDCHDDPIVATRVDVERATGAGVPDARPAHADEAARQRRIRVEEG